MSGGGSAADSGEAPTTTSAAPPPPPPPPPPPSSSVTARHRASSSAAAAAHPQAEAEDGREAADAAVGLGVAAVDDYDDDDGEKKSRRARPRLPSPRQCASRCAASFVACLESRRLKKYISTALGALLALFLADLIFAPPERRLINPSTFTAFLGWVQTHPRKGLAAFVLVYGVTVVLLLPGTPLTIGSGYIYKTAYGWGVGMTIGSVFSTLGSLLGSVTCFLLGRYLMRDRVRMWVRRYPLFDAVDAAVADNGFKIMALLYLTPVLPLGPVSYMCGTTSMALAHFAAAKVACVPLMVFYVFLGASTGTIIHGKAHEKGAKDAGGGGAGGGGSESEGVPDIMAEGESTAMIIFGICLSALSIALISHVVKKELLKILDEQKAGGRRSDRAPAPGAVIEVPPASDDDDGPAEMRAMDGTAGAKAAAVRQRGHSASAAAAASSSSAGPSLRPVAEATAQGDDRGKEGHLA